ncbi:hypothetical protein DI09_127p50 [Mitosporidium daphniae]|uniref:Uncharacterized protein n=1 Tax=Mitosporidium daphniae TaxID=1485682 RepID=A0A098VVP5_9MICR|nr:uncharacterized protein DI09_127p50 [Mitosporidium daphniae]KGG52899.1 hypothetical protein DI09_127p50 [Mitosporidium daphniae]|eukprot:XP_013239335.1 uncharacterized protein DI09_127p50 [Mitosporidium daphniae]
MRGNSPSPEAISNCIALAEKELMLIQNCISAISKSPPNTLHLNEPSSIPPLGVPIAKQTVAINESAPTSAIQIRSLVAFSRPEVADKEWMLANVLSYDPASNTYVPCI